MNVRELLTKWGFKVEGKQELDSLEKQLEGIKHRLDFMIGVEVVKGLFELAEKFSHVGDAIHIAAEQAGISVEEYQKLAFSAAQASVSQEELGGSMTRLARQLYAARNGSDEAQKSFRDMGITDSQVRGFKTTKDALLAISDRFHGIEDPIKKAALGQQVLGRSSAHMVAYLSQGSGKLREQATEAEKLGLILNSGQVTALKDLESALGKFWALLKAIGASVAADVAPVFKYLIEDFIKFFKVNRQILEVNITTWLGEVAFAMGFVWEAIKYGITLLLEFAKAFGFDDKILSLIANFASLIGTVLLVGKVFKIFTSIVDTLGKAWTLLTSPIILFLGSLAAIVISIHDIYEMLFNGKEFKDTWLGKFLDSFGLLDKMYGITDRFADAWAGFKNEGGLEGAARGFGLYGDDARKSASSGIMQNQIGQPSGVGGNSNQYAVNAPITVTVPHGTDPTKVGEHVQIGVREHLNQVYRETQRSTKPAVAY